MVLGRAQEVQYYENHYTRVTPFLQDGGPREAYTFARDQHDKRIGIAGSGEIYFGQYGFYGANLDNYVQYIGVPGPAASTGWRRAAGSSGAGSTPANTTT